MKYETSAHASDRLKLNVWDILKLIVGCKLKVGALVIAAYRNKERAMLAKAVLSAHSGNCDLCPHSLDSGACNRLSCGCSVANFGCYCDVCKLARSILSY